MVYYASHVVTPSVDAHSLSLTDAPYVITSQHIFVFFPFFLTMYIITLPMALAYSKLSDNMEHTFRERGKLKLL